MSRVCPSCGYDEVPDQTDWCPRCNEFLAWDRNGEHTTVADSRGAGEATTVTAPVVQPDVQAPPAGWSCSSVAWATRVPPIARPS
jgi:hypothetical protein